MKCEALLAYAYGHGIKPEERIFSVSAVRVWQVVKRAFAESGIRKPDHVGTVHVLRHSRAIGRLEATGNLTGGLDDSPQYGTKEVT